MHGLSVTLLLGGRAAAQQRSGKRMAQAAAIEGSGAGGALVPQAVLALASHRNAQPAQLLRWQVAYKGHAATKTLTA
ncbi:hypothetical protein THAOC_30245, partial [Thalassiosira oceanica]